MVIQGRDSASTAILKRQLLGFNSRNEIQKDRSLPEKRKICEKQSETNEKLNIPGGSSDANKTKRRKQSEQSNEVCNSEKIPNKKVIRPKSNRVQSSAAPNSINKENSTFLDIVSLNCKLTNEMLDMKRSLSQKTNALSELEKRFHEKSIECIELKSKISKIEKEKSEKFCDDLISFDDAEQTEINSFGLTIDSPSTENHSNDEKEFSWSPID